MKKSTIVTVAALSLILAGCSKDEMNFPKSEMDVQESEVDSLESELEMGQPFSINDLLIDNHILLSECPFWNINKWQTVEEVTGEIYETASGFDGVNGGEVVYEKTTGITYTVFDGYVISIMMTDDTYSLHAGVKVGDMIDEEMKEQYQFIVYDKETAEQEYVSYMEEAELGPSALFSYDSIYYTKTFISQEESDSFIEEIVQAGRMPQSALHASPQTLQIMFYTKDDIITGICIEL